MRQERLYTLVGIFIVGALSLMIFGAIFFTMNTCVPR